jgi:hypothetical protein
MNAADFRSVALPEALQRLAEMPRILRDKMAQATPAQLRLRPDAQSFCLIEHACHLRDLEREGYAVRLARMLEETMPALEDFEGDVIARERDYMSQDGEVAAAQFAAARAAFLSRAEALTGDEMSRTASFMGRTITVCDLLAMMVEHDRGHRADLEALWK